MALPAKNSKLREKQIFFVYFLVKIISTCHIFLLENCHKLLYN